MLSEEERRATLRCGDGEVISTGTGLSHLTPTLFCFLYCLLLSGFKSGIVVNIAAVCVILMPNQNIKAGK